MRVLRVRRIAKAKNGDAPSPSQALLSVAFLIAPAEFALAASSRSPGSLTLRGEKRVLGAGVGGIPVSGLPFFCKNFSMEKLRRECACGK